VHARQARIARRPVHGVLLLDKPLGLSSNNALQKAKWLLQAEKAGHTGTLDPLATGVLPLCFGAATKFSQLQLDADKTYEAVARLGVKTSTGDAEGEVIDIRPVRVTGADLAAVTQRFTGVISQTPPMYSALKKDGRALYDYARAGLEVDRAPRSVAIYQLDMALSQVGIEESTIKIIVKCSKGTYIRTLAEDIGEALGCGAHLVALRRMATGGFDITQCVSLAALEALSPQQRLAVIGPVDLLLDQHVAVTLDAENAGRFLSGMRRRGNWPDTDRVVVHADKPRALLGTGHVKAGELIPGRLLSPIDIRQMAEQAVPPASEPKTEIYEKVNHE
jgi:tRNA pseudouridine55 synthase